MPPRAERGAAALLALSGAWQGLRAYSGDRLRLVMAVGVLALGVGLGLAISLVNRAAQSEFTAGLLALSGEADLTVRGPRSGLDEHLLTLLAGQPQVAALSPVVAFEALCVAAGAPGRPLEPPVRLSMIGIDALRARGLERDLIGQPAEGDRLGLIRTDRVFVGRALQERLQLKPGDPLWLRGPTGATFQLQFGGLLPAAAHRSPEAAVLDIAAAQYFGASTGRLSRIDLRLRPGTDPSAAAAALAARMPAGVVVQPPREAARSDLRLSRAYRVNLGVLALVALFCGGLLIFSSQALLVARRRQEFALLRALGLTRAGLLARLSLEAVLLGLPGAGLGVALAYGLAWLVLRQAGGDLGAGFFRGLSPAVEFDAPATLGYFAAGVLCTLAGAWLPAREAARMDPARGLKPGALEDAYRPLARTGPGLALLAAAIGALYLPGPEDLPLGGYVSIALILLGAVALMPRLLHGVLTLGTPRAPAAVHLAFAQLRGAPTAPAVSLAAIVASVSLAVAMAVMVHSFRVSFQDWLGHILPADAYLGDAGLRLDRAAQARIAALPGVVRVEFMRTDEIRLVAGHPAVALLARDIDPEDPGARLPLVSAAAAGPAGRAPAWVSEQIAAQLGLSAGDPLALPIDGQPQAFYVAGVWRDYGRQQGAVVIERSRYEALSGQSWVSNVALWLSPGTDAAALRESLRWIGPAGALQLTGQIRALSVGVFDRTFAVTYALVAVAVIIGLAALAANLSTLTLARRRELAVLRHLGLRRRDIVLMLLVQTALIVGTAVAAGIGVGLAIGAVLIFVVNRQSFHWGMQFHLPVPDMAAVAAALVLLGLAVALLAARRALSGPLLRSAAEDW